MEATAVSVGKAVLDGALGYAKSKAAEEIALQLGVERDVTFITDELQMMQSFLMTADEERAQSKVLTTWVKQVRELAYNVEDSLMDFGSHSGKKPFWGCIPRGLCDRRRIAKEVKDLRAKVEDVSNRNLRYRLIKDGSSSKPAAGAAEEQASIASAAMFGINEARLAAVEQEKSKANLLQLITSEEVDLRVMAVWGTAGDLGKTSAIQEVYDDPMVNSRFGFRAWVRLIHPFNPKEFLWSLVRQFYENLLDKLGKGDDVTNIGGNVLVKMEKMDQGDLVRVFSEHLSSNSYLIVINDISTIEEWHCIKKYFPDNNKRSRIVVSTQQVEIASLCTEKPYQVSELKQLSYDQTLYLFHKKLNKPEEQVNIASASIIGTAEARLAAVEKQKLKMDLCQLISDQEEDLRVFALQETASDLGMFSVIREVYDDSTVHGNFGYHAWVRLIHPFNPKEFLQNLVRQLSENSLDELEKGEEGSVGSDVLKMEFSAQLSDKRYLIVINGISTIEEWDCIKKYFPDNKNRSRVIISMQQVEIGSSSTEKPYQVLEIKPSGETFYPIPKVMLASGSKHMSDSKKVTFIGNNPAPSEEIQEEREQSNDAGGKNLSTSAVGKKLHRTRTMALVDEVLIGRKSEKSKVIELVGKPEDEQGRKVISVWGMGGQGKTTLVRSIYRSQQLGGWKRAWVTALRPFNPEVLIRSLAFQLQKDVQEDQTGASGTKQKNKHIATMTIRELTDELSQLLQTQDCLIVVDDLSSTEEWDLIKNQLAKAKRIVVTTRENSVAKHCTVEDTNMYRLQALEHDEALGLFITKVFKQSTEKNELLPDMMDQAIQILKKCDGLPLAISTIGGFLATKPKTAIEWRKINGRISAELQINPELRTMKTVLMRSYDGLPYHLKSCFLYMSIFPEDYRIRRNRLIRRWIAEGYAREMHGMTAMEVGDMYFDELLDRSMILPAQGVNHHSGKIDSCQIHDIIREICISNAREENLVFTLEEGCCLSSTQGPIRHLVVSSSWKRDKDVFEGMLDLSHVRSLTVFGEWRSYFVSNKMRFLRILDLEDTLGLRDHHLDQIGQLLHLRYLSLRGCRGIFWLPNSLRNLRHLQTLDIKGTHIIELSTTITKLAKLQHVRASGDLVERQHGGTEDDIIREKLSSHLDDLSESLLSSKYCCAIFFKCSLHSYVDIEDRPEEACEEPGLQDTTVRKEHGCSCHRFPYIFRSLLFHSRMCCFSTCYFLSMLHLFWRPQNIEDGLKMDDIFHLYRFLVKEDGSRLWCGVPKGFGKLKALETLDIVKVAQGKKNGKATLKELAELTQLRKLGVAGISSKYSKMFWSAIAGHSKLRSLAVEGSELDACLGGDLLPPKHLESIKLRGKLVKVKQWIHQLQNLSKMQVEKTELEQDDIQTLGMLPNLAALRMSRWSFVGEQLHFQGSSFPSLMVLELHALAARTSVSFEEKATPKLELLQVTRYATKELSGLEFLKSLKEIRLGDGINDNLKEKLQNEVKEDFKHVSLKLM